MKTERLIELLKKADPTLQGEVCIDNKDILEAYPEVAYWDGRLIKAERNSEGRVIGAIVTSEGIKINLYYLDLEESYIESILDDRKEWRINTEGDMLGQEYLKWANWRVDKITLIEKSYLTPSMVRKETDIEEIKNLCVSLKKNIVNEAKDKFLCTVNNYLENKHISQKCYDSTIKFINDLYSKVYPIVLSCPACGSNFLEFNPEGWYTYAWKIYKNGDLRVKTTSWNENRKEIETTIEEFDWETFKTQNNDRYGKDN